MSWFKLNEPVGTNYRLDTNDLMNTKRALNQLGYYDIPPHRGIDDWTDEPMFDGLKRFQKDNGLKVDAFMRPGGPTERAINKGLAAAGSPQTPEPNGGVIPAAGRREPNVRIPSQIPQNQRDSKGRPITCPPMGEKDRDDPTKQWDSNNRLNTCEPTWWGGTRWVPGNISRSKPR